MYFSLLNYKFLFIITLFNSFLSLLIEDSDLKITDNYIDDIILNSSNNYTIKFNISLLDNQNIYLSLISKNNSNFTINSNFKNATTKSFSNMINSTEVGDNICTININSSNDNIIQIIHIKNNSYSSYRKITEDDDETIEIKKKFYNFVKFLDDDKNIKVEIKFKDNLKNNVICGIVRLLSNNENYIPRVETFKDKGLIDKYNNKKIKKEKSFEIKNIEYDKDDKKNGIYTAFILSINSTANIEHDYSIIINEDIMNEFLIGSIIVALIFAVITFFLIRRKQNVGEKKTGEEFYEEKQEEEKEP
jgi:preprotein translocase subunit YajC